MIKAKRSETEHRFSGIQYPGVMDRCRRCRKTYAAHIRIGTQANSDCFRKHVYDFRSDKERAAALKVLEP